MGEITNAMKIEELVRAMGCKNVRTFNPHNLKETRETIKWALNIDEASVIIARYPCALKEYSEEDIETFGRPEGKYEVNQEICIGCKVCMRVGCPAILFETENKKSYIDMAKCFGCSVCAQVCPKDAIQRGER